MCNERRLHIVDSYLVEHIVSLPNLTLAYTTPQLFDCLRKLSRLFRCEIATHLKLVEVSQ